MEMQLQLHSLRHLRHLRHVVVAYKKTGRARMSGRGPGGSARNDAYPRFSCVTVLPPPMPTVTHVALMSCLPPATFSRSASLSSPSPAACGTTTYTVSAVSTTAFTLTLPSDVPS